MYKWFYVLMMICVFNGCAVTNEAMSVGNEKMTDENVDLIKTGMTGAEVKAILDGPAEVMTHAGGSQDWIYKSSEGSVVRPGAFSKKTSTVRIKILTVTLNADDKVINVSYDELRSRTK